jgi:hypothetical protein
MKTLQAEKDLSCSSELKSVESSDGAIINCNYELCVKVVNKYIIQSSSSSIVTHRRDSMLRRMSLGDGNSEYIGSEKELRVVAA